jgi:hypothetical protein
MWEGGRYGRYRWKWGGGGGCDEWMKELYTVRKAKSNFGPEKCLTQCVAGKPTIHRFGVLFRTFPGSEFDDFRHVNSNSMKCTHKKRERKRTNIIVGRI